MHNNETASIVLSKVQISLDRASGADPKPYKICRIAENPARENAKGGSNGGHLHGGPKPLVPVTRSVRGGVSSLLAPTVPSTCGSNPLLVQLPSTMSVATLPQMYHQKLGRCYDAGYSLLAIRPRVCTKDIKEWDGTRTT